MQHVTAPQEETERSPRSEPRRDIPSQEARLVGVTADLRRFYVVLGVVNTVLLGAYGLIMAGVLKPGLLPVKELDPAHQLNLQSEGVAAVWYMSVLCLLIALGALANFRDDGIPSAGRTARWQFLRFGWLLLAAGALFVSVDETAQFHDGLGVLAGAFLGVSVPYLTDSSSQYAWVVLVGPPLLIVALFLLAFFNLWLAPTRRARILASVGIGLWALPPLFEFVESRLRSDFGVRGLPASWFLEESAELLGATILLVAVSEYAIARGGLLRKVEVIGQAKTGLGSVAAGVALPLTLVPLALAGVLVTPEARGVLADTGYYLTAASISESIATAGRQGHHLVLASSCDPDLFAANYEHPARLLGPIAHFPSADTRGLNRDLVITTLAGDAEFDAATLASGLTRAELASAHLWHMQCGRASEADRMVDSLLASRFASVERLWLPGLPTVTLTHVQPVPPLRPLDSSVDSSSSSVAFALVATDVAFGEGGIRLIGYEWEIDEASPMSVLRVVLLWQADQTSNTDYHVSVQMIGPDGKLVSQSDGRPVYDRYDFTMWAPGETVLDAYDVPVPKGQSLKQIEIAVGLYDHETGERLLAGQADRVTLKRAGE